MRLRRALGLAVGDAALLGDPGHDRLVAVGLVHREDVLEDRCGALEPHAGVDVLLGQRRHTAVRMELELHEDEVPELEEALAVAARRALGAAAADACAAVVEHLRVAPARPRPSHRPEVVRAVEREDALGRLADPEPGCTRDLVLAEPELRIAGEDRDPEALHVDLQVLRQVLPREVDRAVLEVLAEREVAEHLEEGQMVAVEADLVDVGRAEALLHGDEERRRRCLAAQEVRHQRLHAGAVQERRAVPVGRDQRARRVPLVALGLEVGEKALAELCGGAHA